MKKNNEGYALPFVLVVFLVITLAATGVLTVSLHNLKAQKASALNMQEKYAAQGEIEKAEACIRESLEKYNDTIGEAALDSDVRPMLDKDHTTVSLSFDTQNQKLLFTVQSQGETMLISAVISIAGTKIELTGINSYAVTDPEIAYDAYTITAIEGGAAE